MIQLLQSRFVRTLVLALVTSSAVLIPMRAAQASDLSGHWEGSWYDCGKGHHGVLKGDFCKLNASQYQVNFRGRFFKVFPFRYSVVLNVVEEGPGYTKLRGTSNLGRLFGTFSYDATVAGNSFQANYSSCKYKGVFKLTKCCG